MCSSKDEEKTFTPSMAVRPMERRRPTRLLHASRRAAQNELAVRTEPSPSLSPRSGTGRPETQALSRDEVLLVSRKENSVEWAMEG